MEAYEPRFDVKKLNDLYIEENKKLKKLKEEEEGVEEEEKPQTTRTKWFMERHYAKTIAYLKEHCFKRI